MSSKSVKNICRMLEVMQSDMPVEQEFLSDLQRSIEMTERKNRRKPSQTYKPSGMNCMRQSYYQILGKDPDDGESSYALIGICETGTDRHERIQNAVADMKNNGMDCEYIDVAEYVKQRNLDYLQIVEKQGNETKLYHKTLNISFLCDGIIKYHNHYYIIEFKTEGSSKFFARNAVDQNHYKQATAYSLALGIDNVLFVYISRDTLNMKTYMFNVTSEMKEDLVAYIEECDNCISQLKVPPKSDNKKACMYCGYKLYCTKDGE